MEWLSEINFWHWLIFAVVLISVEMLLIGSYYLLWLGIAAGVVGALLFLIPSLSFLMQVLIFTVLSVVTLVAYKQYQKNNPVLSDQPKLNRRGEQYIGRVFTLENPIVNGVGKVRVDDSTWKVSGEDMTAGTKIKVTAVEGTTFLVEAEA
jgi:membrane protein implicated in regulation of membrane protease activity